MPDKPTDQKRLIDVPALVAAYRKPRILFQEVKDEIQRWIQRDTPEIVQHCSRKGYVFLWTYHTNHIKDLTKDEQEELRRWIFESFGLHLSQNCEELHVLGWTPQV